MSAFYTWSFALLGLLILLLIYGEYREFQQPDFRLLKNEWTCAASESRSHTTFVMSGKVLVPVNTVYSDCIKYERKK